MSGFIKPGAAISKLGSAASPAGGGGAMRGDVRLFAEDPGAGWLAEDAFIPYNKEYATRLVPSIANFPVDLNNGSGSVSGAEYINGALVTVTNSAPSIRRSLDEGVSWETPAIPSGHVYNDVLRVGNRLIAVGNSRAVAISEDNGANWSAVTDITGGLGTDILFALATDGGNNVVIGANNSRVYISTNGGLSFTAVSLATPLGSGSGSFSFVAYASGKFFAQAINIAQGLMQSANMTVWTLCSVGNLTGRRIYGIFDTPDKGLVAFLGNTGNSNPALMGSSDGGLNFGTTLSLGNIATHFPSGTGNSYPSGIAYENGLIIVAGSSKLAWSYDWVNWTSVGGLMSGMNVRYVKFLNNYVLSDDWKATALMSGFNIPVGQRHASKLSWKAYTKL